jgi:hypothetical protein
LAIRIVCGAVHGFSNPKNHDPEHGLVYDDKVDQRSWKAMQDFFAEIFAKSEISRLVMAGLVPAISLRHVETSAALVEDAVDRSVKPHLARSLRGDRYLKSSNRSELATPRSPKRNRRDKPGDDDGE